jgi:hypothetical protein
MRYSVVSMLLAATLLQGCASLNSIYRTTSIKRTTDAQTPNTGRNQSGATGGKQKLEAKVVTVDAKQRHLLINPERDINSPVGWRMCSEAAPDVFSVFAASGALEGNKDGGKAGFAGSETGATIERTQTINLLRESMYRTCERYLSGAIDKRTFIVQAARDQRSMVAVLAVEQLTGAIRAKPTIITGPGTSASLIDGKQAADLLEAYTQDNKQAKKRAADAATALEAANTKGKCVGNDAKPEDASAEDWDNCRTAKAEKQLADAEAATASKRLDLLLGQIGSLGSGADASTQAGQSMGDAYSVSRPGDSAIIAVANAVTEIARAPGVDEPLMFCIAYLSEPFDSSETSFRVVTKCLDIIQQRADSDLKLHSRDPFVASAEGSKIISYLNSPNSVAERQRRMSLARNAAMGLNFPSNPVDLIGFIATASPTDKQRLLQAILVLETDSTAKDQLK